MKKFLLMVACAALTGGVATAQVNEKYAGAVFSKMSPNGKWLVQNANASLAILDRNTGLDYGYADDDGLVVYTVGLGSSVTDEGIIVGSAGTDAFIWQNGQMTALPQPTGKQSQMNIANAITADATRIVGLLGFDGSSIGSEGQMAYPAVWTKNAEGGWDCQALPYPDKDFTGRSPQYVTAVDVSDDGKTVVGQVRDYSGFYTYPIVYKEDAQGNWSYSLIGTDKVWDADKVAALPTLPADPGSINVEDYMSEQDKADYEAALEYYNEQLQLYYQGIIDEMPEYPVQSDYISDTAKKEQYDSDYAANQQAQNEYWTAYYAFMQALDEATTGAAFSYNSVNISRNGKFYASVITQPDPDNPNPEFGTSLTTPVRFDLTAANVPMESAAATDQGVFGVMEDGTLLTAAPLTGYSRNAYVVLPGETKPVKFLDYMATRNEKAAQWVKDNCTFDVTVYNYDENYNPIPTVVADSLVEGSVTCNPQGTIFLSYLYDMYTDEMASTPFSYLLDLNEGAVTGIDGVTAGQQAPAFTARYEQGRLVLSQGVTAATLYDVAGRRVATTDASGALPFAPAAGTYVVRMQGADGTAAAQKLQVK